jgi:signal transduction histidine kinase
MTPRLPPSIARGGAFLAGRARRRGGAPRPPDELVGLVSHELRTPLTSILGYLELLLDQEAGPLTEEQHELMLVVRRNAERLQRSVDDMLVAAEAGRGRLEVHREPVDLSALVRDRVDAHRGEAARAGVALELDDAEAALSGDRRCLAQLVDNLLSNALKFTPAGGRVTVRVGARAGRARIEVADTGVGISPAEQGHLFDRFSRGAGAERAHLPGAGLGLAIVRIVAEGHDGAVRVDSREGHGATFQVDLPAIPLPERSVTVSGHSTARLARGSR